MKHILDKSVFILFYIYIKIKFELHCIKRDMCKAFLYIIILRMKKVYLSRSNLGHLCLYEK